MAVVGEQVQGMALDAAASGAPVKEEAKPAVAGEVLGVGDNEPGLLNTSTSGVLKPSRLCCLSEPLQLPGPWLVLFSSLRSRAVSMQLKLCLGESKFKESSCAAASDPAQPLLPPGWATAKDPQGRTYYWHTKTKKVTWEKPTAETPVE